MFKLPEGAKKLPSAKLVRGGRPELMLAFFLLTVLILSVASLKMIPWYQSVNASGKVTYYNPMERPQEVDSQIPARIVKWLVMEGDEVKEGQQLAILEDIDSKFLAPDRVQRMRDILLSYQRKREAAMQRLGALEEQRSALTRVREAALPAAQKRVAQSQRRQEAARQTVLVAKQNLTTDQLQFDRLTKLRDEGLRSQRDYELGQQNLVKSQTELARNQQSLEVSRRDIDIAELDLQRLNSSFDNDFAKLQETWLKTQETIAEVDAEMSKLRIEIGNYERRGGQQVVTAPTSGRVVRLAKIGAGKTVKAGDPLCRVVPEAKLQAVELYITDSDAPLVRQGQAVRLMFDGFPAVPFTAWPWAAIGTFPGRVAVVDAADDGSSRYRVLVVPDAPKLSGDMQWPSAQESPGHWALRPGTQAQGWIMMDKPVPLYWELWRRLNAFPPVPMADSENGGYDKGNGKPNKTYQPKPVLKR